MDITKLTPSQKAQLLARMESAGLLPNVQPAAPVAPNRPIQRDEPRYPKVSIDQIDAMAEEAVRANGAPQAKAPHAPLNGFRETKWQAKMQDIATKGFDVPEPDSQSILRDTSTNVKRLTSRDKQDAIEDIDTLLGPDEMLRRITNPTDDDSCEGGNGDEE